MVKPPPAPSPPSASLDDSKGEEKKDYINSNFSRYLPPPAIDLARGLLTYNPRKRWSAKQALLSHTAIRRWNQSQNCQRRAIGARGRMARVRESKGQKGRGGKPRRVRVGRNNGGKNGGKRNGRERTGRGLRLALLQMLNLSPCGYVVQKHHFHSHDPITYRYQNRISTTIRLMRRYRPEIFRHGEVPLLCHHRHALRIAQLLCRR